VLKQGGKGGKGGQRWGGARASPRENGRARGKGRRTINEGGDDSEGEEYNIDSGDEDVDNEGADGMNETSEGGDSDDNDDSDDNVGGDICSDMGRVLATSLSSSPPSLPLSPLSMAPAAPAWRCQSVSGDPAPCVIAPRPFYGTSCPAWSSSTAERHSFNLNSRPNHLNFRVKFLLLNPEI
jgi:hypothetical protein